MYLNENDFTLMKLEECETDLLDNSFEPPLRAHQCDGSNDFSMEHAQSPVLPHTETNNDHFTTKTQ